MCVLQVSAPRLDVTLSDLQDLASRQQQQINAQQQLLASKVQFIIQTHKTLLIHFSCTTLMQMYELTECVVRVLQEQRLRYLKLQDQRQQQQQEVSEQERLRQLRENAHNQEAKLRRVRALRGQVEQKRLSNSKLGQCDGGLGGSTARFLR